MLTGSHPPVLTPSSKLSRWYKTAPQHHLSPLQNLQAYSPTGNQSLPSPTCDNFSFFEAGPPKFHPILWCLFKNEEAGFRVNSAFSPLHRRSSEGAFPEPPALRTYGREILPYHILFPFPFSATLLTARPADFLYAPSPSYILRSLVRPRGMSFVEQGENTFNTLLLSLVFFFPVQLSSKKRFGVL